MHLALLSPSFPKTRVPGLLLPVSLDSSLSVCLSVSPRILSLPPFLPSSLRLIFVVMFQFTTFKVPKWAMALLTVVFGATINGVQGACFTFLGPLPGMIEELGIRSFPAGTFTSLTPILFLIFLILNITID